MRARLCLFGLPILALAISCSEGRPPAFVDNDDSSSPVRGGTLKVVGLSDVDHLLSSSAYSTTSIGLLTLFTRQLVAYPLSEDFKTATQVAPDLAEELPTVENGGISRDNRTYTFHLRRGVMWNTTPPREVNAHDLVRGLKLICNPVNPSGAPGYYTTTIAGMKGHCDAFAKVPGTVADIRRFIENREIEGVRAKDDFTVVVNLIQPASDFLNILAMTFASALPLEYLDYLPDSPEFRQQTISNGPYQIVKYTPNREIQLERNPVWSTATDPLRPAHADRISIVLGIDQQLQQLQIAAGTADLSFDMPPPTSEVASLLEIGDPKLLLSPPGDFYSGFWYLTVNRVGPNNGGPLAKLEVREAIQYAINKAAVVQVQGGPQVSRPARQAVASTVSGYRSGADMYGTPMDKGDLEKAKELLSKAGFASGLSLKLAYPQSGTYALIAQTIQASLRRINIDVQITSYTTGDYYGRLLDNSENARRGVWDLALAGWYPDWNGANNGRSVIQPLFDGRTFGTASMDYGGYNSDEVNLAIDRALIAPRFEDAEKFWAEAAARVMKDIAIIPLYETKMVRYHSGRVRNCLLNMWSLNCDMTGLWLKDAALGGGTH
jgi:peptide/nickel transport system substrate-binding protein